MNAKLSKLPNPERLLPTRLSLLSRLKNWDDQESWLDFFHTYWGFIYSVAIRSGLTDAEAQEVVQETVIDVSKHMPGFRYDPARGSFKGWLSQLTHWRIKDQLRLRQREARHRCDPPSDINHPDALQNIADPGFVAPPSWEDEWNSNLLRAAIQRVKRQVRPKQFQIFDLYVLKEWPIARVTQALGVSVGQVYLAKHRLTALIEAEFKSLEARLNTPQECAVCAS